MNNILVDIDSLLDTRLALAMFLDEKSVSEYVKSKKYYNRVKDNYGDISYDIFKPLYKLRNKKILEFAIPTLLIDLIKKHYGDIVTDIKNIENNKVTIFLNIYPYDFNITEQDIIKKIISDKIPSVNIKIVSMSLLELQPLWIKENISTVFMYDTLEWLELHTAITNLINTPLLDTLFIAPAIVTGNLTTKKINKELFHNIIATSSLVVDLNFIDVKYFSCLEI